MLVAALFLHLVVNNVFAASRPIPDTGVTNTPTNTGGTQTPTQPAKPGTTSQIQIVYQPPDIYSDGDGDARTTFAIRALAEKLKGPKIIAGSLRDEDSSRQLPTEAFELVGADEKPPTGDISTTDLTRISIRVKSDWLNAGKYSGTLWIGAVGDSGAQSIAFKVFVRPQSSWYIGLLAIAAGAVLSWFAIFWVSRQRQMAANQVLISRLQAVVDKLQQTLRDMAKAGAPAATQSLAHLVQLRSVGLPQLMNDKELSVIAGVTVPAAGSISVVDEVDGINRIVLHGFQTLFTEWTSTGANQTALLPLFQQMDTLGATPQPLNTLDTKIQAILVPIPAARLLVGGQLPQLPSEDSVVHRVVATTYVLDLLSIAVVIVVGVYVLLWKNPGFGTIGNYIESFVWGLGLKGGADLTKLGPGDIRTGFGIKTPTP
jgi:hypothetical protein